jgi:hypothetical protein
MLTLTRVLINHGTRHSLDKCHSILFNDWQRCLYSECGAGAEESGHLHPG